MVCCTQLTSCVNCISHVTESFNFHKGTSPCCKPVSFMMSKTADLVSMAKKMMVYKDNFEELAALIHPNSSLRNWWWKSLKNGHVSLKNNWNTLDLASNQYFLGCSSWLCTLLTALRLVFLFFLSNPFENYTWNASLSVHCHSHLNSFLITFSQIQRGGESEGSAETETFLHEGALRLHELKLHLLQCKRRRSQCVRWGEWGRVGYHVLSL